MKKNKFIKLKMIWAIIKGRTVVYRADFAAGTGLMIRTEKGCIVENHFIGIQITDYKGEPIIG
jgi:hypothetical protein